MTEPYTNRELDAKFLNLLEKMAENHKDVMSSLGDLNTKVGIQNGRTLTLEKEHAKMQGGNKMFRYIASPLIIVLLGVSGWMIQQTIQNSDKIATLTATK